MHFIFERYVFVIIQAVGTATRGAIPNVPMFTADPAKRPRRETLAETLTTVGETIVSALRPGGNTCNEGAAVSQVF